MIASMMPMATVHQSRISDHAKRPTKPSSLLMTVSGPSIAETVADAGIARCVKTAVIAYRQSA